MTTMYISVYQMAATTDGSTTNANCKTRPYNFKHTNRIRPISMEVYVFYIKPSDVIKFVTNDFIPVKTLGNCSNSSSYGVDTGSQDGRLGDTAADDGSPAQWDIEIKVDKSF